MRFNSYQARMALGITRTATTDNRTISMAGFAAWSPIVKSDDPESKKRADYKGYKWCDVGYFSNDALWNYKEQGYDAFCDCMYPAEVAPRANANCKDYPRPLGIALAPWTWAYQVAKAIPQSLIDEGINAATRLTEEQMRRIAAGQPAGSPTTGGTGGGGGGGGDVGRDSSGQTAAPDNSMLILGGLALAAIVLLKR
jgi:hypothetical protein